MAGALTLAEVEGSQGAKSTRRTWKFVPSGSYTAGGAQGVAGETLNFNPGSTAGGIVATNPKGKPRASLGGTFNVDDFAVIRCPAGYDAVLEANAVSPTFQNVILRFFTSGGTELTGAPTAYPAGLIGQDVVIQHVTGKKNG